MSLFKLKLKTKNGNDANKREVFTVLFKLKYRNNKLTGKTIAQYTYRIIYSKGVYDSKSVFELKDKTNIKSVEDALLKIIINLCYITADISNKENIEPDFIIFMSPDLASGRTNHAWSFLKDIFQRKYLRHNWEYQCENFKVSLVELELLNNFVQLNPGTRYMNVDPNYDKVKYAKSIEICNQLGERIENVNNVATTN